jgi:hypothetical protein
MLIPKPVKTLLILIFAISLCLTITLAACAAGNEPGNTVSFGLEVDMLPYLSGGHYISGVVGFDHFNVRLITTKTTIPDFVTPDGFDDWKLDVTAIILDYFPDENRVGLWLGGGLEYWDGKIRAKDTGAAGTFSQRILTFGCGYVYNISEHWYLNPWAAIHYNLSDDKVDIGSSKLNLPDIMYEASVKLGYRF